MEMIKSFFGSENPWLNLAIITGFLLLAFILHYIFFKILDKIGEETDRKSILIAKQRLRWPSLFLLIIFGLIVTIPLTKGLGASYEGPFRHFLSLCVIAGIAWIIINSISASREIVLNRYALDQKDNLRARKIYTQFKMLERILIVTVITFAVAVGLMTFEKIREVGVSLLASAGIAGIILGFAAQKMIGTIIAGFQIALTQPIRIDDVLIVEEEWGWVEEITLTYVVLRIWDKRRLVVPTTYFIEKPFQNWTRISSDILGTVFIYTDYSIPVEELRKELTRLLENSEDWDGKVNVLQVTNASEKTMEIRALMSAEDSPTAWNLRVYVREKMIAFIQKKYPESLPRTRIEMDTDLMKNSYQNIPA